ncbi:hypothetical protein NEOLEDRAFT_1143720 [Neolentinus lepideus HHB14362 ss-1]|uniref:Uncharacterized protein n=1 Tax=Neolentinus lepideus HHB14362 ss-1 TaxID=1314782 RepID=A0A165MD06_9AGAM|nr:hypothetical protein NEOLEDRAFT_1143720 [Neolentinus lepideus HHB14362 ss-1]
MPGQRKENLNSYELTDDALQILEDNNAEFDSASTSTVSDLPGPGRILDRSLSRAGGLLEGILASASTRIGRRSKTRRATSSQRVRYDLDPNLVDFLLEEHVDFETASLSTVSGRPGPGRTLDKLYTAMGKVIESLITNSLTNMRIGPDGAMIQLVTNLLDDYIKSCWCRHQTWRCPVCLEFMPVLHDLRVAHNSTLASLDGVILLSVLTNGMPHSPHRLTKACKILVRCLKQNNMSSKVFTMSYIEALTTLMPEVSMTFDQNGLQTHLKALIGRLSSLGYLPGAEARLLASSRRALVSTADTSILAMIKDYDTVQATFEHKMNTTLLAERFLPQLTAFLTTAFSDDINTSSHLPLLPIIKSLTTRPPPFWLHHVLSSSIRFLTQANVRRWLSMTLAEEDLVRRALMVRVVNSLIGSIGDVGVGAEVWVWETIWLPLCEVVIALSESRVGGRSCRANKRTNKSQGNPFNFPSTAVKPPSALSLRLERHLAYLSNALHPVLTPAPIVDILSIVKAPMLRVLARFVYEWRVSAVMGRQLFALGFQAKVRDEVLEDLTATIIELFQRYAGILIQLSPSKRRQGCL